MGKTISSSFIRIESVSNSVSQRLRGEVVAKRPKSRGIPDRFLLVDIAISVNSTVLYISKSGTIAYLANSRPLPIDISFVVNLMATRVARLASFL